MTDENIYDRIRREAREKAEQRALQEAARQHTLAASFDEDEAEKRANDINQRFYGSKLNGKLN